MLRLDGHRVVRSSGGGGEKVQGSRRSDYHPLGSQEKDSCDSGQDLGEGGTNMGNFDVTVFQAFFGGPGGLSFEEPGPGNVFVQFG